METKRHGYDVFIMLSQSNGRALAKLEIKEKSVKPMGHTYKTSDIHTSHCWSREGNCTHTTIMVICAGLIEGFCD